MSNRRSQLRLWATCALAAWLGFSQVYFPLVHAYGVADAQEANDFGGALLSGASNLPAVSSGVDSGPGTINVREYVPGANESQAWEASTYFNNPEGLKGAVREAHRDVRQSGCKVTTLVPEKYDHPVMTVEARRLIAVQDLDPLSGDPLFDNAGFPLTTLVVREAIPFPTGDVPFMLRPFGADEEQLDVVTYPTLTSDGVGYLYKYNRLPAPSDGSFIPSSPRISAGVFTVASPGTIQNEWTMTGTFSAALSGIVTFWINLHRVETVYVAPEDTCPAAPGCIVSGVEICAVNGFVIGAALYSSKDYQSQAYDIIVGADSSFKTNRPLVADATEAVSDSARAVAQGENPIRSEVAGGGCSEERVYKGPVTDGLYRVSQSCLSEFVGCLGTDCHNPSAQFNGGFGQAASGLAALDQIQHDMTCFETGAPPESVTQSCDLRIFRGTHQTCKIPIGQGTGITPDCCEEGLNAAAGIDLINYFKLVYYSQKLMRLSVVKQSFAGFPGAAGWQTAYDATVGTVKGAVSSTVKAFETSVSGFFQELGFNTGGTGGINLNIFSVIEQALMRALQELLTQMFGEAFTSTIIGTAGGTGAGANNLVFIGPVAWILAAWYIYQILKIVAAIVFKCTEDELRLGISREAEECYYAGQYCQNDVLGICVEKRKSFCCYKSFLSRLFMEEFRLNQNLGGGAGDPADPNCEGLTIEQLQSADWSRVDLTPYIRRLEDAGILPTTAN